METKKTKYKIYDDGEELTTQEHIRLLYEQLEAITRQLEVYAIHQHDSQGKVLIPL